MAVHESSAGRSVCRRFGRHRTADHRSRLSTASPPLGSGCWPAPHDPLLSFVASTCATVARRVLSIVGARRAHSLGSVAVIDPLIERRRQRRLSEVLPTQPAVALGQQRPDPSSDCCFTSPISRNRHQADRWNFGTRTPAAEPSSPPHCQLEYRRVRCDKAVWPGNPRRCAATHPTLTMCLGSPRMKASTLSTSWFARH